MPARRGGEPHNTQGMRAGGDAFSTHGLRLGSDPQRLARLAYVAVIALATLSHIGTGTASGAALQERLARALSFSMSARDVVDGLRNLLLFAGWGLVWCMSAPTNRLARAIAGATLTGFLLSTSVETVQLFSDRRHASIMDVLTNTSGALFGAAVTVALLRLTMAARSARSFVGMPIFVFAAAYGCAALLEILLPGLRQDLITDVGGGPIARFRMAWAVRGWGDVGIPSFLLQAVLVAPAGAFAVAALVEQGRTYARSLAWTAGVATALALGLETARGLTSQPIEYGMFAAHAFGFVTGAWLAAYWLPAWSARYRGRSRPLGLLAAYALMLVLWRWQPFVLHLDLDTVRQSFSADHLMPLQGVTMKMDLFSASVVAVGFLLFLPLGGLLAVWPVRAHGWLAHVLPGLWLVLFVEAGQLFIAGRYFDVTDLLIGGAGILAGWALLRHAGFRPYGELLPRRARV
jgi:glycopeptide antibiotics resistance protein